MNRQKLNQGILNLLRYSIQTKHNRIVTCGLFVGLCYLPTWLSILWSRTLGGSSNLILNTSFLYIGLEILWRQRHQLAVSPASEEDRLIGHFLILGGIAAFPLSLSSASLQAFVWAIVLVGIAFSSWGWEFFKKNWLVVSLLLIGIYPDLNFLANQIWRILTPHNLLENLMAWAGSGALRLIGQAATAIIATTVEEATYIVLPSGSVEVAPGCSGFDMAFTLTGTGFILGLFFRQSWLKIASLIGAGIAIALVFNIPRVMLVTMAAVYWGKASFDFWHGPIGGQIFASILLTIYYYLAMWIINQPDKKKSTPA